MTNKFLTEKAREAIRNGDLPKRSPDDMWGGSASGGRCAVCGDLTKPGELELELEFTRDSGDTGRSSYKVHPRCFTIFRHELEKFDEPSNPLIDGPPPMV